MEQRHRARPAGACRARRARRWRRLEAGPRTSEPGAREGRGRSAAGGVIRPRSGVERSGVAAPRQAGGRSSARAPSLRLTRAESAVDPERAEASLLVRRGAGRSRGHQRRCRSPGGGSRGAEPAAGAIKPACGRARGRHPLRLARAEGTGAGGGRALRSGVERSGVGVGWGGGR